MVMQPEAHSHSDLSPNLLDCPRVNPLPPDSLLVILGALEGAKTHSCKTNPKRGRMSALPCTLVCVEGWEKKMLGGESSWEQRLYSGRMMKKKPLPAAPRSGGAQMLWVLRAHVRWAIMLRGQARSQDLPATHP